MSLYIPEIRIERSWDRWITVYVGKVKVGTFFENEETRDMIDDMYAKMIRSHFENTFDVSFEEEQEDEDW